MRIQSKYDCYISYHPAQRLQVEAFCIQVKNDNLKIWYDHNHENDFNENVRALQSSAMFVCFPSKEYKKNIKNRIEYSIALEQNMKIISLMVDHEQSKKTQGKTQNFINSFFKTVKNQAEKFAHFCKK